MKKSVIILGGGFAGLSAAYELTKSDFEVTIIEERDYMGGLCYTYEKNGFLFDIGGHRLYTKSREIFDFLNDLVGKENFIERKRISRIYMNKKFFDYPLKLTNVIMHQSWWMILKIISDFIYIQFRDIFGRNKNTDESSFENWVTRRFGKTLYNIYFKEYTEKVWREDPKNLHHELASRRISFSSLKQVVIKLLGISKEKTPRTYITELYYPKRGIGLIASRMTEDILSRGGKIISGMRFDSITGNGKTVESISCFDKKNGTNATFKADYFLSTIPITILSKSLIKSNLINVSQEKVNRLRYKGISIVYLMVNKEVAFPDTWLYIPQKKHIVFRVVNFTNWSPFMAPQGKSSICLEISLPPDVQYSDDRLFQKAMDDMEELGLISKKWVEGYFVHHFPHAYPIYIVDYDIILNELNDELKKFSNIISYGRQGAYNYSTMDNILRNGFEVANHVKDYSENGKKTFYDEKFSLVNNDFQELN
ncbi:MAG: FAD-dependent oxidoreductase [Ferruginibacter sp.]